MNRRTLSRRLAIATLVALAAVGPVPARAQAATAPDSFSINAAATGLLIEVSAPAALPLDVLAGLSYAQVGINSQPRIQSTASPLFVPLLQDLGLLGGTSGVLGIVARLGPGLVIGLPTLIGLDPLPIDPGLVPVEELATLLTGLPVPGVPPLGCSSFFPDEPQEAECGGGAQDFFGFRVGAASARTAAEGDPDDPSKLASRSDASVVGVSPGDGQLLPVNIGTLGATAEGGITDGRAVASASAAVGGVDLAGLFTLDAVEASYVGAAGGTAETLEEDVQCRLVGAEMAGERIDLRTDALTIPGQDVPLPLGELLRTLGGALGSLGGEIGPADIGELVITPNPEPVTEVSPDGTSVRRRFGCLEIRYRIGASGTDVRLTLGNIAVSMNAFNDQPFSSGDAVDAPSGGTEDFGGAPGADIDAGGNLGSPPPPVSDSDSDFALPPPPAAGGEAPEPSERPFASNVSPAGWGIDGGWMAPFALLALCIPLLAKTRTFAPVPRPTRV